MIHLGLKHGWCSLSLSPSLFCLTYIVEWCCRIVQAAATLKSNHIHTVSGTDAHPQYKGIHQTCHMHIIKIYENSLAAQHFSFSYLQNCDHEHMVLCCNMFLSVVLPCFFAKLQAFLQGHFLSSRIPHVSDVTPMNTFTLDHIHLHIQYDCVFSLQELMLKSWSCFIPETENVRIYLCVTFEKI